MLQQFAKYLATIVSAIVCIQASYSKSFVYENLTIENAIDSLDKGLANQDKYFAHKIQNIALLRENLPNITATDSCRLLIRFGDEYRRFNVDSAAVAYQKAAQIAHETGNKDIITEAILSLCAVNPLRGIVKESIEQFEEINPKNLNDSLLIKYFDTGFNLYLTSSLYYPEKDLASHYLSRAIQYSDSLIIHLPSGSSHQLYHKGWNAIRAGNSALALAELNDALYKCEIGNNLFARITAAIADCYEQCLNDDINASKYLAISATSDAIAGTRETTSLQRLGLHLFKRGDLERAYNYVTTALRNSIASGSRIRALNDIDTLPIVSSAYRQHDKKLISWLFIGSTILVVATLCLLILLLAHKKSLSQLASYRQQQITDNKLKDQYITHLLELCSTYIARLGDLNKLMLRKLKAGQNADLLRLAESEEFIREQNERFLKSFDETFLDNYPHFIDNLNKLLKTGEQFNTDHKNRLTPELRIAALMRLGIDDGTKISHFLGLSLNTIYTYRNKLKNRSINRNSFDEDIRNLC